MAEKTDGRKNGIEKVYSGKGAGVKGRGASEKETNHNQNKYNKENRTVAPEQKQKQNPGRKQNVDKKPVKKPGDTAKNGVKPEKKQFNRNSKCPVSRWCGGCDFIDVPYTKQLMDKQEQLEKLLKDYVQPEPIIGMTEPFHYRNKVNAAFGRDRNGNYISGIYEEASHNIIKTDSCFLENELADRIIVTIRGLLKSFKITTYSEQSGFGLLRHVMVRTGRISGQVMVVLVLTSPILPSKNNFVKALRSVHPEITTVVLNVNDKDTSMVLGERNITLYGPGFITDKLCGVEFMISPGSFYQVNPVQTEILYNTAISYAGLSGKELVLDAYCGIGTIGLIASATAKEVIGVELNRLAVKDAIANAKKNGITNAKFYAGDAGEFMERYAAEGKRPDVVFMDPPRSGSTEQFINSLLIAAPKKVVYVSCNPETLVRDLKLITKGGYKVERAVGVDQFPFTQHCEVVALLSKVK